MEKRGDSERQDEDIDEQLRRVKLPDGLTVQDIVELPSFRGAKMINGTMGLDRYARSIVILERVLPHFINSGHILLAMGDFVASDSSILAPIADRLSAGNISAFVFKRASFRGDLLERAIHIAGNAGFAMIELPPEANWLEVCLECVGRLSATEAAIEVPFPPVSDGADMLEQISSDVELQTIIDTLSRALETSVTIMSPNYRLLGYSATDGPTDILRQQTILSRRMPQSLIDIVESNGIGEIMRHAVRPIRLKGLPSHGLRPYIWGPIRAGSELLGIISVMENDRPLGRADKIMVERAAAAAAWSLLRGRVADEREQNLKEDLVSMLLSEENPPVADIVQRAARLGYDLTTFHRVMVAEANNLQQYFGRPSLDGGPEAQHVGGRLKHIATAVVARSGVAPLVVQLGRQVVVLVPEVGRAAGGESLPEANTIADGIREKLHVELPGLAVSIGIGERLDNILDLRRSYEEARHAVWVSQKAYGGDRTLFFEEMGVYKMLGYQNDPESLQLLRNPAIERLIEYDRGENGEFLRTLEVFLDNVGHPKEMAKQLYIHRSTLQYRLERIEAITGSSLNDAEDRLNLHIGLKLLKLLPL